MMDPKFVNLLIQQLLNTTTCPKCGSSISPINVKVESIGQENCLFKMQCARCKTVISADAQMTQKKETTLPNEKVNRNHPVQKEPSLSTPVNQTKNEKKAVSLDDIMLMQKQLQNFSGSFKNLFQ